MQVWHEHKVIATYPDGTSYEVNAEGALLIAGDTYRKGEWLGVGSGLACVFLTPSDDCPNCHPQG